MAALKLKMLARSREQDFLALKAHWQNGIRISGDLEGHEIWVDRLDVKKGNKYTNVWSWKEQRELYKGGGG